MDPAEEPHRTGKSTAGERDEAAIALSLGISPRRWQGWEPAEVSSLEYDDQGRLTRIITVREPEWSAHDRRLIREVREEQRVPRGRHGIALIDAIDPKNADRFIVEPVVDFAQTALDKAEHDRRKIVKAEDDWSLIWRVALPEETPPD